MVIEVFWESLMIINYHLKNNFEQHVFLIFYTYCW